MPSLHSETTYISVGCNRLAGAADQWLGPKGDGHGLVAFGADHRVALYHPQAQAKGSDLGVLATLPGHKGRVNCVKFLNASIMISGATDGSVRLWTLSEASDISKPTTPLTSKLSNWHTAASWKDHQGAVVALACLSFKHEHLVITAGSDGTIRSYLLTPQSDDTMTVQANGVISLGSKPALTLALTWLVGKEGVPLLAVAGTDTRISLYLPGRNLPQGDDNSLGSEDLDWRLRVQLTGHDDWIRSMDFIHLQDPTSPNNDPRQILYLATASQDKYVRIWRIEQVERPDTQEDALLQGSSLSKESDSLQLSTRSYLFHLDHSDYSVQLDAILLGHEDWVHSVRWALDRSGEPFLVTASADKSVQIWHHTGQRTEEAVWENFVRVGEAAGPGSGFFGAFLSMDTGSLVAYSYHGAFHRWDQVKHPEDPTMPQWIPQVAPGGHFRPVQRLAWDPQGRYLLSVSLDQTARLHGQWRELTGKEEQESDLAPWCEMGRPQVHGYDMRCCSFIGHGLKYASASDEKVIRVFDAPQLFSNTLTGMMGGGWVDGSGKGESLPLAANLPALGLSNKAILPLEKPQGEGEEGEGEDEVQEMEESYSGYVPHISQTSYAGRPPIETELRQQTFWPETQKLYGHGYEVTTVDASMDGLVLASACRATKPEHAGIRLHTWDRSGQSWKELTANPAQPLLAHQLTVTRIRFSPDSHSAYLLAVSRDRSWSVNERKDTPTGPTYRVSHIHPKAHARIIWDAAWSVDGAFFVTASRDKSVKVWSKDPQSSQTPWILSSTLSFPDACTSVALSKTTSRYVMAIGLEDGSIHLCSAPVVSVDTWTEDKVLKDSEAHHSSVLSLSFSPSSSSSSPLLLASSSSDHQVRLTRLTLTE